MNYKCFLFCCIFLILTKGTLGQDINWKTATNWKLYNIFGRTGFTCSLDTLKFFKSFDLDDGRMQYYIADAKILPLEKNSVWMGLYVATCQIDKRIRKVLISNYGGFFYDEIANRQYEFPESVIKQLYEYLSEAGLKLSSE